MKSLALLMLTRSPFDAFDNDLRDSITRIFRKGSDVQSVICRANSSGERSMRNGSGAES